MKTIEQLKEALESAIGGGNTGDIEQASADLADARRQAEIGNLKRVLTTVLNTLPHIGGNARSIDSLMKEIRKVLPEAI